MVVVGEERCEVVVVSIVAVVDVHPYHLAIVGDGDEGSDGFGRIHSAPPFHVVYQVFIGCHGATKEQQTSDVACQMADIALCVRGCLEECREDVLFVGIASIDVVKVPSGVRKQCRQLSVAGIELHGGVLGQGACQ